MGGINRWKVRQLMTGLLEVPARAREVGHSRRTLSGRIDKLSSDRRRQPAGICPAVEEETKEEWLPSLPYQIDARIAH